MRMREEPSFDWRCTIRSVRCLSIALVLLGAPCFAFALTLDSFTDPFPANGCLPSSAQPILFIGPYCDGAVCPPDPIAGCWENEALQSGLPGVLPGHPGLVQRGASLSTLNESPATARVRPALGRLEMDVQEDVFHGIQLSYGGSSMDMALDLAAAGATGLAFEVFGDPTPARPLQVSVSLATARPILGGGQVLGYANYTATLDHTGPWLFPFSAFQVSSEFSFAEVDYILIEFTGDVITPGGGAPHAWALGALRFESAPTASVKKSWGRLKALYR